ncbi:hypothetical protein [Streptomyces microflavus]
MSTEEAHEKEPRPEPGRRLKQVAALVAITLLSAIAGGVAQAVTEKIVGS